MLEVTYTPPLEEEPNNNWSGAWYDPTLDGEGYQIFDTPVGWIIYFFGYTPDGENLWLVSDVNDIGDPVPGQSYNLQMLVGTPGTFNNPSPPAQLVQWGTLQIIFTNCTEGLMVLESTSLTLLKISNVVKLVGIDGSQCVDE